MTTKDDVPKVQELIPPTVDAMRELGGSGTLQEINDKVAELLQLPEDVQEVNQENSSDTWFSYRMRWSRTYLKKAGLADNSQRGVWTLTAQGKSASEREIREVWRTAKFADRKPTAPATTTESVDDDPTDEEGWKEILLTK